MERREEYDTKTRSKFGQNSKYQVYGMFLDQSLPILKNVHKRQL